MFKIDITCREERKSRVCEGKDYVKSSLENSPIILKAQWVSAKSVNIVTLNILSHFKNEEIFILVFI